MITLGEKGFENFVCVTIVNIDSKKIQEQQF